MKSETTF